MKSDQSFLGEKHETPDFHVATWVTSTRTDAKRFVLSPGRLALRNIAKSRRQKGDSGYPVVQTVNLVLPSNEIGITANGWQGAANLGDGRVGG